MMKGSRLFRGECASSCYFVSRGCAARYYGDEGGEVNGRIIIARIMKKAV